MLIASFIFSIFAMLASLACLVIMLAKNFFSTHTVQYVDPLANMMGQNNIPSEIGQTLGDHFREIGDPVSDEELEYLENLKKRRAEKK